MRTSFWVKLNFLVLGLFLVVYAISKFNSAGMQDNLALLMGLRAGLQAAPPGTVVTQMDWCDTRVRARERPGQPTLRQEKLKWLWQGDPVLELNFIAVEKWFGRYCRVMIDRVDPADLGTVGPAMTVHFIKGEPETLMRSVGGVYRWRQEIFRSSELDQALKELEELPESGRPTSH